MFSQQIGNISITWGHTYWIRIFEDGAQEPGQSLQEILKPAGVCEGLVSSTLKLQTVQKHVSLSGPWGADLNSLISVSLLFWLRTAVYVTTARSSSSNEQKMVLWVGWTQLGRFLTGTGRGARGGGSLRWLKWGRVIWMIDSIGSPRFLLHSHAWHWTEMASSWLGISM